MNNTQENQVEYEVYLNNANPITVIADKEHHTKIRNMFANKDLEFITFPNDIIRKSSITRIKLK